jgi:hypothetical protein
MSSQPSIPRYVNNRQNALCLDEPAGAPDPISIASPTANLATEMAHRPPTTIDGKRKTFPVVRRESTPPAKMTMGKMLTTKEAAALLGRPHSTLERWRCEGRGPDYVKQEGGVRYYEDHLREYIRRNTRTSSVQALVETKREYL